MLETKIDSGIPCCKLVSGNHLGSWLSFEQHDSCEISKFDFLFPTIILGGGFTKKTHFSSITKPLGEEWESLERTLLIRTNK